MKLYVIAGEASGDLHGSNLMQAILDEQPQTEFRFWGGDKMIAVQDNCVKHIRDLAFMGFVEVLMNIRTITKNMRFCKEDILAYQPDAIVMIDYPGFNLRIAEWAKEQGIKVIYYISPQVWAWKQNRVQKIKRVVDKMYVILPFEKDFYKKFDYEVEYVGHPLLDEISKYDFESTREEFRKRNGLSDKPIIALVPGSRKQEVKTKLPIMVAATKGMDEYQLVVAGAPSLTKEFYQSVQNDVQVVHGETYELMYNATAALVTSGTATLETALFKVPEVVCYKGSQISYSIAKRLVKVDYISLVNLIMGREVVKELIQKECNPDKIRAELDRLLNDEAYKSRLLADYDELQQKLGGGGASAKVAQSLLKTIEA
ncbi:MAG: lipid-A-disaccharide synthase [Fluviicola sp. XM-24bin1]|nr:MAG: lipid-A-disaccharide synthase [Fluviicola sp. XM-24bin1]